MRYIAITIGPIYKTFQNVRKTRELWAASYIFSYLSRRLIEEILLAFPETVLVPYYDKTSPKGVGLYPDRIYLKCGSKISLDRIQSIKETVLTEISRWMLNPDSFNFLNQYFRVYAVEYSVKENENPLIIANKLLDTAELRNVWQQDEATNILLHFLRNVNTLKINKRKWIKDHLDERDVFNEVRFESLPEISTRAIRKVKTEEYQRLVKKYCYTDRDLDLEDGFIKEFQQILNNHDQPGIFKNYHKYVCIVKADGDKVGKFIHAIDKDFEMELSALSKSLYDWGVESASIIKRYSGLPVYIGGDDLLFLAPVAGENNEIIIDLTRTLNDCFIKHFATLPGKQDEKKQEIKPTLSFGISITYYKYPLFEALAKADSLLNKSKETRNACSISLMKHSGSSFDITVSNSPSDLTTRAFSAVNHYFSNNASFVSSIIHHFRENESIYRLIGEDESKTLAYLQNNFEDQKHQTFVVSIAELCHAVYVRHHGTSSVAQSEKSIKELYSLLRILKFLNGQEDGK